MNKNICIAPVFVLHQVIAINGTKQVLQKKGEMILASCSVLPDRVLKDPLRKSVQALCENKQIQNVYIHYPSFNVRLQQDYPPVPEWMTQHPKIIVHPCADFGPITKIAALLEVDEIPDSKEDPKGILLFDDDQEYPTGWWDGLLKEFEAHNYQTAVSRCGSMHTYFPFKWDSFNFSTENDSYSILCSRTGVVYPVEPLKHQYADALISLANKWSHLDAVYFTDLILSSFCHKQKVPRLVIPSSRKQIEAWKSSQNTTKASMSGLRTCGHGGMTHELKIVTAMIMEGEFPIPWADIGTIVGCSVLVIIILILFFFMILV